MSQDLDKIPVLMKNHSKSISPGRHYATITVTDISRRDVPD